MSLSKLTVLESASSIILTKRHRKDGTDNYGDAKWYAFQEREIESLSDLAQAIDSIADSPSKAIILDQFVGAATASKATHNDEPVFNAKTGRVRRVIEAFRDDATNILCFDIDGWVGTDALQSDPLGWVSDPESAILEWVEKYLPSEFQNVDFYWQVSSSAGLKPGVRAHVWFWVSDPVYKSQIAAWVERAIKVESTVDKSLYSRVRIHYTATPIFDGVDDPVSIRSGLHDSMVSDTVNISIQDLVEVDSRLEFGGEGEDDDGFLEAVAAQPPLGLTEGEAADAIAALDEEWFEDRAKWLEIGMALHHEFTGDSTGFRIWDEWSQQSDKYVAKDMKTVWKSFRQTRRTMVKTMASVMKTIKATGVAFEQLKQKLEPIINYRHALEIVSKYDLDEFEAETVANTILGITKRSGMSASIAVVRKAIKKARSEHLAKTEAHKISILEDWIAAESIRQGFGSEKHLLHFSKMFWCFNSGYWHKVAETVVGNRVYQLVMDVMRNTELESLRERLTESGRTDALNALVNSVTGIVQKRSASELNIDPLGLSTFPSESIMNCLNGELVFRKKAIEFRDHNPDNRLTAVLSAEYDPEAECPEWDKALERIFLDYPDRDDMIRHLHEVMGYVCQTKRNLASWVMFYGKGSNGKSFIGGVLQALIGATGSVNVSLGDFSRHNKNDHVEAQIVGKMLMIDDDFEKGAALPDGTLKKLSEAKTLTANPKFADSFNFVSRVTPVLLTNHWPRTSDNSYGLTRRAIVFNFKNTLSEEEKDIELLDRITKNELGGVLNHMIAGWERLQKRGRFDHPPSCILAKQEWLGNRNVVAVFLSEKVVVTCDANDTVFGSEIWDEFKKWGIEENSGSKWGRNSFYSELTATPGVSKGLTHDDMVIFRGMRMKEPPDPMEDELI